MGKEQASEGGRERREARSEDRLFEREERGERRERAKAKDDSERLFWREEPRGKGAAEDIELFHEFGRGRPRGWEEGKPPSWL